MTDDAPRELSPRMRRIVELVYAVEGVVAAKVWEWNGQVAVGVRAAPDAAPDAVLHRVEAALAGVREPDETWDFGILEEEGPGSSPGSEGAEPDVSSSRRSLRSRS